MSAFTNLQKEAETLKEAIAALEEAKSENQILTGIHYLNPDSEDFHGINNTTDIPLNQLTEAELCPGNDVLQAFNESLR